MGDWTGTVPTILAGDIVTGDDWDTVLDIETALTAAWTTWVPTLTNLTKGSGVMVAKYRRTGKTVDFRFKLTLAADSAVGTDPQFTPPVTPSAEYAVNDLIGSGQLFDATGSTYPAAANWNGTSLRCTFYNTTPVLDQPTATVPFTWTTSDRLHFWGTYYTD